jgi:hypothetical protein
MCIVFLPSAFLITASVPVSPRLVFTMSKRNAIESALAQNVSASFFSEPFSVIRAFDACGNLRASFAISAA